MGKAFILILFSLTICIHAQCDSESHLHQEQKEYVDILNAAEDVDESRALKNKLRTKHLIEQRLKIRDCKKDDEHKPLKGNDTCRCDSLLGVDCKKGQYCWNKNCHETPVEPQKCEEMNKYAYTRQSLKKGESCDCFGSICSEGECICSEGQYCWNEMCNQKPDHKCEKTRTTLKKEESCNCFEDICVEGEYCWNKKCYQQNLKKQQQSLKAENYECDCSAAPLPLNEKCEMVITTSTTNEKEEIFIIKERENQNRAFRCQCDDKKWECKRCRTYSARENSMEKWKISESKKFTTITVENCTEITEREFLWYVEMAMENGKEILATPVFKTLELNFAPTFLDVVPVSQATIAPL